MSFTSNSHHQSHMCSCCPSSTYFCTCFCLPRYSSILYIFIVFSLLSVAIPSHYNTNLSKSVSLIGRLSAPRHRVSHGISYHNGRLLMAILHSLILYLRSNFYIRPFFPHNPGIMNQLKAILLRFSFSGFFIVSAACCLYFSWLFFFIFEHLLSYYSSHIQHT